MKYLLPVLVSTPTVLTWIFFILRMGGHNASWGVAAVAMSFVALCGCIAMTMVKPQEKEWRVAAVFNAIPFILVLAVVGLLQVITSD